MSSSSNENMAEWYSIQTTNGQEQKAKTAILNLREEEGLQDAIFDVLVPTEDLIDINKRTGKKKIIERSIYSGYIFAKILLDPHNVVLSKIQSLSMIYSLVGYGNKPVPLTPKDVEKIKEKVANKPAPKFKKTFTKGETVLIKEGEWKQFTGIVEADNIKEGTLTLTVTLFKRKYTVNVLYIHVDKIE